LQTSRRREAKRRALLQMLDRLPVRAHRPAPQQSQSVVPAPVPAAAPAPQVPLTK